jgi:outer membrane protein OmpA-like peptidoglycan-associated protein
MVTLLLTFFVMLLTLADVQDPDLFDKGRDSFLESLRYMGLGVLFGRSEMAHLGEIKTKHPISHPDEFTDRRTIDAKAEELRRILQKLKELTTVTRSPVVAKKIDFSITNIHFSPGRVDLNETAKKFLTEFSSALQQDTKRKPIKLYVLGLASDAKTEKEQWFLSAKRAQTVADFLRGTLSPSSISDYQEQHGMYEDRSKWTVYSWGAGPGGDWVSRDSPISKDSQILIAVLRVSG